MPRIRPILLLFILTQATAFAQVDSTAYVHAMADSISVGKSTSDTTTEVVGKLNLVTFDDKQVQLCLVPVNGARLPNATQLQAELNSIFAPAVASVTVTTHGGVTIGYANGKNFVHGGSGWLSVYNTDQKTAIDALTDAQDDVYYLFFVDNAVKLDPDGNRTIVAGYMPICRRYGFIYDNPTSKYVAHELAHGAFALHHTFSDESESYRAPQGTTPNLMDYSGGTALNHLQWQWMHESHTNLLGFLDDESEGELKDIDSLQVLSYLEKIHKANFDNKKSLVLNIDKDWSYGKSGQIALDDSTELSYLFMFALTFNEEKGNTISDVTTTKAISIIPYERNKTVSTNDGVSYTTYKFKTEQKFECLSFTVKTDECEVFENYLYSPNVDISDKVTWISQFDDVIKKECNSGCCCYTCNYILRSTTGLSASQNSSNNIAVLKSSTNYNDLKPTSNFDERISYMKEQLKKGNPVVVGVHRNSTDKPYNTNGATRHFVVVVGMGYDEVKKKNYFRFYEVGTNPENEMSVGTNSDNRLYLDSEQKTISGYTTMTPKGSSTHPFYSITEIRTSK